ncbi:MAG: PfkB family carbohydrate kinase [Chloroflexota bacterium]|nr:PfkB family carbohydrate kinase [Chloroflexota bacterium]
MNKILIAGSSNVDITHIGEFIPDEGQTLMAKSSYLSLGGKGLNQAVASKRLSKNEVFFLSVLGDDFLSKFVLHGLKQEKINSKYLRIAKGENTGSALIFINKNFKNHISVSPEANLLLNNNELNIFKKINKEFSVLLLQQEIPIDVNIEFLKIANESGIKTIYDPGPPSKHENFDFFKFVDFLTPNKHEAEFILGKKIDGFELEAAKELKKLGSNHVIITLGSEGLVYSGDFDQIFKPIKVNSVDPVGSGDCFNGALASMINKGEDIFNSINFAQRAAAFSTTRKGASQSFPFLNEIK